MPTLPMLRCHPYQGGAVLELLRCRRASSNRSSPHATSDRTKANDRSMKRRVRVFLTSTLLLGTRSADLPRNQPDSRSIELISVAVKPLHRFFSTILRPFVFCPLQLARTPRPSGIYGALGAEVYRLEVSPQRLAVRAPPLERVCAYDPIPASLSAEEAGHILGAQGQLWTEYIPDPRPASLLPRAAISVMPSSSQR